MVFKLRYRKSWGCKNSSMRRSVRRHWGHSFPETTGEGWACSKVYAQFMQGNYEVQKAWLIMHPGTNSQGSLVNVDKGSRKLENHWNQIPNTETTDHSISRLQFNLSMPKPGTNGGSPTQSEILGYPSEINLKSTTGGGGNGFWISETNANICPSDAVLHEQEKKDISWAWLAWSGCSAQKNRSVTQTKKIRLRTV